MAPDEFDFTKSVRLEKWADADFDLLRQTNAPDMMRHLGGSESDEQILARHQRYLGVDDPEGGQMFSIRLLPAGERVGVVGYWPRVWQDQQVLETGWSVLPAFQGMGLAAAGTGEAVTRARADGRHRYLHAFPSVTNPASNAICRKLNFVLLAELDFEYPPGKIMRCNDWRLDLGTRSIR